MADVKLLLDAGRSLLREEPALSEADFRDRMLERFRAADRGLQHDQQHMAVDPNPGGAVFSFFLLPWTLFRWLGWLGRLAKHRADMDEVVRVLRGEGHFGPA